MKRIHELATARVRHEPATEEALRWERDAERLIETAPGIVLMLDMQGRVARFNAQMEQISGYKLHEAKGSDWVATFVPERERQASRRALEACITGGSVPARVESIVTREGVERRIEWHVSSLRDHDGTVFGILAIGQDVTERERAERRLVAQYAVTRVLAGATSVEEAAAAVLEALCQATGWEFGELWCVDRDTEVLRWRGAWHASSLDTTQLEAVSRTLALPRGQGLPGRVFACGEPAWVADVTTQLQSVRAPLAAALGLRAASAFPLRARGSVIGVIAFYCRDDRPPDTDLLQMLDAVGSQIGDFIERRRAEAELQELQKQSLQRERLADIGVITAKLAHDLGNPLAGLSMQAQLVLRRARMNESGESIARPAEKIVSEVRRLEVLINEFREFSRDQRLFRQEIDLHHFLREVVDLWQPVARPHAIALSLVLPVQTPVLRGDADKLRRVFDNLVKNAVEAIEPGAGQVVIKVAVPEAVTVRISVEDTGPGIPASVDVFRLFETTKPHGSGLGLTIAREIVIAHGGSITFIAREPHGTVFHVDLPLDVAEG